MGLPSPTSKCSTVVVWPIIRTLKANSPQQAVQIGGDARKIRSPYPAAVRTLLSNYALKLTFQARSFLIGQLLEVVEVVSHHPEHSSFSEAYLFFGRLCDALHNETEVEPCGSKPRHGLSGGIVSLAAKARWSESLTQLSVPPTTPTPRGSIVPPGTGLDHLLHGGRGAGGQREEATELHVACFMGLVSFLAGRVEVLRVSPWQKKATLNASARANIQSGTVTATPLTDAGLDGTGEIIQVGGWMSGDRKSVV